MPIEWIKFASLFVRIGVWIGKITGKKVSSTYKGFKFLKAIGSSTDSESFRSIYFSALKTYESNSPKHPDLIHLFSEEQSLEALRADMFGDNTMFLHSLNLNIHTKPAYSDLKASVFSLENEVAEFIQHFHQEVEKRKTPKEAEASHQLKQIQDLIVSKLNIPAESIDISEHISEISELRKANQHRAVLNLLENFKRKKWQTLPHDLKYKVTLNIAVTLFELNEKSEGAKYFIELINFDVRKPEGFAFAALGFAVKDDTENAIKYANKAIDLDADSEFAYLALLFSKEDTLETSELDELIPKHIQHKPGVAINIASFLDKKGDFEQAFTILSGISERGEQLGLFECDVLVQMATNRIASIEKSDDYFFEQLSDEASAKLQFALDKLTTAWNFFKNTDLAVGRHYVIANRGVVYKVLGDLKSAEADLLESLALKESFFAYKHLLEIYSTDQDKFLAVLKKVQTLHLPEDQKHDLLLFQVIHSLEANDESPMFEELLSKLSSIENGTEIQTKFYSIAVEHLIQIKQTPRALEIAFNYAEKNVLDPFGYYLVAKAYLNENNNPQSEFYLKKAASLCKRETRPHTLFAIAELLLSIADYKTAAEVLSLGANLNRLSKFTKKLIVAHFQSGNYSEASNIAKNLLKSNKGDPFLTDIVSSTYEATGQYQKAIEVLKEYLKINSNDEQIWLKHAIVSHKNSDVSEAVLAADKVQGYDKFSLEVQLAIAQIYVSAAQLEKGFEIAYHVRVRNYSNQKAHIGYVQIRTQVPEMEEEVKPIGIDTYVMLTNGEGTKIEYILVEQPQYQHDLGINEPIAQKLLNKNIGDVVEVNGEDLVIQKILSKYVYAFQDSIQQIGFRFNDNGMLRVMHFKSGDNPVESLRALIDDMDRIKVDEDKLDNYYIAGQTTIGVNANALGISPIKYWGKLITTRGLGVYSATTALEFQLAKDALSTEIPIILDVVALLTGHYAHLFDLFKQIHSPKFITTSTLDIIESDITQLKNDLGKKMLLINKVGSELVKHEVTEEEKQQRLKSLQNILRYIEEDIQIVDPPLPNNFATAKEQEQLLHKSFHDILSLSQKGKYLIWSDDLFFRQLAFNDHQMNGISTSGIAHHLLFHKSINVQEFNDLHQKLIKLNYRQIPVNPTILFNLLSDGTQGLDYPFIIACDVINPVFIGDLEAVKLIGDLLYLMYNSAVFPSTHSLITQFVVQKLLDNRERNKIKRMLIAYLDTRFKFLPLQKLEVFEAIKSVV